METTTTTEPDEFLEGSADAPQLRWKHNDHQPLQQPDSGNAVENLPASVSAETAWPEQLSMETLAGLPPASEALTATPRPLDGSAVIVEELTLSNYKDPSLSAGGCSNGGAWMDFRRTMAGAPLDSSARTGREEPENNSPQLLDNKDQPCSRPDPQQPTVFDNVIQRGEKSVSLGAGTFSGDSKANPPSNSGFGFARFFAKSMSKGKGITDRHQAAHDVVGNAIKDQDNEKFLKTTKSAEFALDGGGSRVSDMQVDGGINLREWHHSGGPKSKEEALRIFKQIVEFVAVSHSQGSALQCLRLSHFVLVPTNQVKYIGTLIPRAHMEQAVNLKQNLSKRKMCSEQDKGDHDAPFKNPRHTGQNFMSRKMSVTRGSLKGDFIKDGGARTFGLIKQGLDSRPQPTGPTASRLQPSPEIAILEERWYASPEELHGMSCFPFASNVYGLGIILFELFCHFESREAHISAMSDLQHRILPPNFLKENPKEAGFCLWLLHPEPPSRPKSREVLLSDLLCEGKHLSSPDRSTTSNDEEDAGAELLMDFLLALKSEKEKQAAKLAADVGMLAGDIEEIERRHPLGVQASYSEGLSAVLDATPSVAEDSGLPLTVANQGNLMKTIDQLENAYFSLRSKIEFHKTTDVLRSDEDVLMLHDKSCRIQNDGDIWHPNAGPTDSRGAFFEDLCKYARYSKFEVRGILRSGSILNPANVICSLSFDRDEDFFATAGVSKKIKIFEFQGLLNRIVDVHYPVIEMSSASKLSCVNWNSYIKNYLASTDYEGVVQLWDASTGQGFSKYVEHQKRAWSVDFSLVDPTKLASGSDDCSVKLWTINEKKSINTIRSMANVCCVQFSSHSSHLLSFGSADYKVYCYDLRQTRVPWCTLAGHNKAVSYVKFVDPETVVSASTDGTLKLWDLKKTKSTGLSLDACSNTLSGHTNERNFVGLTHSDGYIACGSETNEVYAYYRNLPMPIASHKFGSVDPNTGQVTRDDHGQFVSSVCWRGKSGMILAANSSGTIKLLQMV